MSETPVNKHPILDCEAKMSCGTWVPHTFSGFNVVKHVKKDGKVELVDEIIFACDKCSHQKKFGQEPHPRYPRRSK